METDALDRLLAVTQLLGEDMNAMFAREGLTPARTHLLWEVARQGPSTQRVLADALSVTPRNITGLVDGLVASGFVSREPHAGDRRATLVTLTPRGLELTTQMQHGYIDLAGALFGDLPAEALRSFTEVLGTVLDRLRIQIAEAGQIAEGQAAETGAGHG